MDAQNIEVFSLYDYASFAKRNKVEFEINDLTYHFNAPISHNQAYKILPSLENRGSRCVKIEETKNSLTNLNNKIASENNYLIPQQIENFVFISNTFDLEKERLEKKGAVIPAKAFVIFNELKNLLNDLPIENCGVELMEEKVKITVTLPDNKMIMVSKPMEARKKGYDENEIMASFFINKRMINSNVSKIETFKESFDEFNFSAEQ